LQSALSLLVQFHRGQRETGSASALPHCEHQQEQEPVLLGADSFGEEFQPTQVAEVVQAPGVLLPIGDAPGALCAQFRLHFRQGGGRLPVRLGLAIQLLQIAVVFECD